MVHKPRSIGVVSAAFALLAISVQGQQQPPPQKPASQDDGFRFKSGVELVNVTATISD